MHELIANLHMHTRYSDGTGSHADIASLALKNGLDVVIITDHNIWTHGFEGYQRSGKKRTLLLVGEEVHDQARNPQKNHLLIFGAEGEMATYAHDPQQLIDRVIQRGGLAFIAHPVERELKLFGEDDLSWVDWDVTGYTGIELWNGFSEFKSVIRGLLSAVYYALFPNAIAHAPEKDILTRWDHLLASGKRIVAIGGSDAHALNKSIGPFRRTIFPYSYHFRAINTHLFTPLPLSGDLSADRRMIYEAMRKGNCFVGYDRPAPTRGFRFTAQSSAGTAWMGDELTLSGSATLQIRLPIETECRLFKDGELLKSWDNAQVCTYITNEPGVYRVECYIYYHGARRG